MSWWPITVYSIAALLAVRMLFSLMIQHRKRHLQRLMDEDAERRAAEADAAAAAETTTSAEPVSAPRRNDAA